MNSPIHPAITEATPLVCPCGTALSIYREPNEGRWMLEHMVRACSPIVSDVDANKVLTTYIEAVASGKFKAPTIGFRA